jgi:hypothetical protein
MDGRINLALRRDAGHGDTERLPGETKDSAANPLLTLFLL